MKVSLSAFPDYVFDKDYQLMDLNELDNYLTINKHLPGIITAAEVKKNDGINLGEMNAKLLEKVEELTLYLIQMKKENEEMKKDIEQLKKR